MSGASVAKKIAKAYGKLGKKLGYTFVVYRSTDYVQPIDDRNVLPSVQCSYSYDKSFEGTPSASFQPLKLGVDSSSLQEGDILVSAEAGTTITLVAKFDMRQPVGIETTRTITISRTTYNTTGGFGPKATQIYTDVPVKVLQASSAYSSDNQIAATKLGGATPVYDVWTWLPTDKALEPSDTIVFDDGKKGIIQSIELNDLGYKLKVLEVE